MQRDSFVCFTLRDLFVRFTQRDSFVHFTQRLICLLRAERLVRYINEIIEMILIFILPLSQLDCDA